MTEQTPERERAAQPGESYAGHPEDLVADAGTAVTGTTDRFADNAAGAPSREDRSGERGGGGPASTGDQQGNDGGRRSGGDRRGNDGGRRTGDDRRGSDGVGAGDHDLGVTDPVGTPDGDLAGPGGGPRAADMSGAAVPGPDPDADDRSGSAGGAGMPPAPQADADQQPAPVLAPAVDAGLGDETRELLIRGEIDEALHRHDGSQRPRPEEDEERTSGEFGGSGGDQEGGAG